MKNTPQNDSHTVILIPPSPSISLSPPPPSVITPCHQVQWCNSIAMNVLDTLFLTNISIIIALESAHASCLMPILTLHCCDSSSYSFFFTHIINFSEVKLFKLAFTYSLFDRFSFLNSFLLFLHFIISSCICNTNYTHWLDLMQSVGKGFISFPMGGASVYSMYHLLQSPLATKYCSCLHYCSQNHCENVDYVEQIES